MPPSRVLSDAVPLGFYVMPQDYNEWQRRVSARAYQIWVAEGRPADRGVEHWNRAAEAIAAQDAQALKAMREREKRRDVA